MRRTLPILFCYFFLAFAGNIFADVVTLKDGRQVSGSLESGSTREIRIKVGDDTLLFAVDRIQSILFDPTEAAHPQRVPSLLSAAERQSATPAQASARPASITLPAGTTVAIRTIDHIDSKKADKNKEYAASLDDPIVVDGETVVPANASAFLRVGDIHSGGFKRGASMSMSLVAILVNGQRITVETGKVDSANGSRAKRTATGALAGAAGGAVIGAIAGGALGAGIGAGVGAVGGAITGKLTGKGVEIAPETRFSYTLSQPVVISNQGGSR